MGMLLPSEVEAKAIIPALRSLIAKKLVNIYHLPQQKVAEMLGITQAAVSNYIRDVRGIRVSLEGSEDAQRLADEIIRLLLKGVDQITLMNKFHEAVVAIKAKRLMCDLHQKLEPDLDTSSCHICEQPT
ncbi:MAG: transcriptional regulator [Nitrososphaerales archaeon]